MRAMRALVAHGVHRQQQDERYPLQARLRFQSTLRLNDKLSVPVLASRKRVQLGTKADHREMANKADNLLPVLPTCVGVDREAAATPAWRIS